MLIKDYWCHGCGLVGDFGFRCPVCNGALNYGSVNLDLSSLPNKDLLMNQYSTGTLFVSRENGRLALRDHSVGPVQTAGD